MPLILELERIIKRGGHREADLTHSLILRFLETGFPFWIEIEVRANGWLFCFFELQVEPKFLSLRFY